MQLCLFVSRPRSGSTVLRKALADHPQVVDVGEVFNEENPESFFEFLGRKAQGDPKWVKASFRVDAFLHYVTYIFSMSQIWKPDAVVVIMDVKYDHLHLIYHAWQDFNSDSTLFNLSIDNNWLLIHLIRRNVLASVLSNFISRHTKIYHRERGTEAIAPHALVRVNIDEAFAECEGSVKRALNIRERFRTNSRYLELTYEEMFDKNFGNFSQTMLDTLRNYLQLDQFIDPVPKLSKVITSSPMNYIINADEIVEILAPKVARLERL